MSVWVLKAELPAQDEQRQQLTNIALPFEERIDMRGLSDARHALRILRQRYPEKPPETLARRFETDWQRYTSLQDGDTLAVPMGVAVVLFEACGKYYYDEAEAKPHRMPVKWQCDTPLTDFKKWQSIFATDKAMTEITFKEEKVAILQKLPHSYNRFAKWQWWMAYLMIGMGLMRVVSRMHM